MAVSVSPTEPWNPGYRWNSVVTPAVVRLVPNATHCAMQKAQEIVPWSLRWLRDQLV